MTGKVDDKATWYSDQESRWAVSRTLLGGTEAMRGEPGYLEQFPQEPAKHYERRLRLAVLTNFYAQIAARMIGLVFRDKIEVAYSDIPQDILDNIDNRGRDIHAFAESIAMATLTRGLHHILIEAPVNPGALTLADDKKLGLRPYWVSVPAETCISAFASTIANREVLGQVRYRDDTCVMSGWDIVKIERIRVLNRTDAGAAYELWVKPEAAGEYTPSADGAGVFNAKGQTALPEIPWVTVYGARRDGFMRARSVIQDIAFLNIEHWQSASDQRNILTLSRYPMQTQVGTDQAVTATGPAIILHHPGNANTHQPAEFGYTEPEGRGIEAGERDLDRIVEAAEMLAIQLRIDPQQTATGADINQGSTTSNLVTFAHGIEQGLNEALVITAAYLGIPKERAGKAKVNKDFTLTAAEEARITALLKMREGGDLSRETMWAGMKELGVLPADFAAEDEVDRIGGEPAPVPVPVVVTQPVDDNAAATS